MSDYPVDRLSLRLLQQRRADSGIFWIRTAPHWHHSKLRRGHSEKKTYKNTYLVLYIAA